MRDVKLETFLIFRRVKRNVIWAKISTHLDTQNALRCGKRRRLNATSLAVSLSVTRLGDFAPFGLFFRTPGAFFEGQGAQIIWLFFGRFLKMTKNLDFYVVKSLKTVKMCSFKEILGKFFKISDQFR